MTAAEDPRSPGPAASHPPGGNICGFTTAADLIDELMEGRDDLRLLNLQRQLARLKLLIIDDLGFAPLSSTGTEHIFEVFGRVSKGSPSWSRPTCLSTSGPATSDWSGSPARCWTALPTMSFTLCLTPVEEPQNESAEARLPEPRNRSSASHRLPPLVPSDALHTSDRRQLILPRIASNKMLLKRREVITLPDA